MFAASRSLAGLLRYAAAGDSDEPEAQTASTFRGVQSSGPAEFVGLFLAVRRLAEQDRYKNVKHFHVYGDWSQALQKVVNYCARPQSFRRKYRYAPAIRSGNFPGSTLAS